MEIQWVKAPIWAKYVACDHNGEWWWFEHKPCRNYETGTWSVKSGYCVGYKNDPYDNYEWADSMQRRESND